MRLDYALEISRAELEAMGLSITQNPIEVTRNGKPLKPTRTPNGITYQFWFGRQHFTISGGRLIWAWFYGSISKNERVRFIDKDWSNLELYNLQIEEGVEWKNNSN